MARFSPVPPIAVSAGMLLLMSAGLSLFLVSCGGGASSAEPSFSLTLSPASVIIYPSSGFAILVTANANASSAPTVTLGTLPPGITSTTTFPLAVPSGGASISFQTNSTVSGTYTLTVDGQAGSQNASATVSATVQTNPPGFFFLTGLFSEVAVSIGGSGRIQMGTGENGPASYDVQLSVSGLPPGTTATISPPTIVPGESTTVTITASSTAPESQNVSVTLTGTPDAPVPVATASFLVDVAPPPGSLPDNRTDYVSTEDTPYWAVYDPVHQLIFASNESWNRVDVISAVTHAIVTHVPLPDPRGIDITQDDSMVWVATGSRQVFGINTATLAVSRYLLPQGSTMSYWEGSQLLTLSDGTVMIVISGGEGAGASSETAIWNPATNAIRFFGPPQGGQDWGLYRSGDGTRVYYLSSDSGGGAMYYDVQSETFSNPVTLGGYAISAAVNTDGTRVVVCDANGPNMYDGNFNLLGPLPACGFGGAPFFEGGSVFSADNLYLYQEAQLSVPVIIKIDANTLNIVSIAPAMPMIPVMTELSPPYYVPIPFAVDATGMVFGLEDWGIAFDDGAFSQSYSAAQPGTPTFLQHMDPYFGPLSGGTTSGGFGNAFSITPTVWYGANRGIAALATNTLTITSPSTSAAGPVNIKMLFPDGMEVFDPLFFSYGPYLQYPLLSGSSPEGNVPGQIVGFGMPGDDNLTGTLAVGSSGAALGPAGNNGLPFAGTPFPNKILSYTVPPGSPGWADITLTTPDGTSTVPKGLFYAQSVTDYNSPDRFTAILYDKGRQQLYLSAGDHIDVFSLNSNTFLAPLTPPAQGTSKQFAGLALMPDGSLLLATDLLDGSLAVIDPDNPSSSYVIPIAPVGTNGNAGCSVGPLYVAATSNNEAFVALGGMPGIACGPGGTLYLANLTTHTAGPPPTPPSASGCSGLSAYIGATDNGEQISIGGTFNNLGFCIYDVAAGTYSYNSAYQEYGATFSGDGNVAASQFVFTDSSANLVNRVARPDVCYAAFGTNSAQPNLQQPQLDAAGSLYYMAYSNFIDIVDVLHGILRMRFSLSETVSNVEAPIAIDPGGDAIYLTTNQGLTIVDLGEAPLSIGWLNATTVLPNTQVTIRGSGFNSSTTATVGGEAAVVSLTDENTLMLTVPNLGSGPATIVLTNSDGTTYTAAGLLTIQ